VLRPLHLNSEQSDHYIAVLLSDGYDNLAALSSLSVEDFNKFGIKRGHAISITKSAKEMQGIGDPGLRSASNKARLDRDLEDARRNLLAAQNEAHQAKMEKQRVENELEIAKRNLCIAKKDLDNAKNNLASQRVIITALQKEVNMREDEIKSLNFFAKEYSKEREKNERLRSQLQQEKYESPEGKKTERRDPSKFPPKEGNGREGKIRDYSDAELAPEEGNGREAKTREPKESPVEYVRKAKAEGKSLKQIMIEGNQAGYTLQHIQMAYNDQHIPIKAKIAPQRQQEEQLQEQWPLQQQPVHVSDAELARRLHEEEEKRAQDNQFKAPKMICTSCRDEVSVLESISCRNEQNPHFYCMYCFTGIVKSMLEENKVQAPCSPNCPVFTSDDFYKVQDQKLINRIDQVHRDNNTNVAIQNRDEKIIQCPEEGCGNYEVMDAAVAEQNGYKWNCTRCLVYMCIRCNPHVKIASTMEEYFYHIDNGGEEHECEEDRELIIQEWITVCEIDCSTMTCSACQSNKALIKNEGCNVVNCPDCRTCICFTCGKDLGPSNLEAHNKYPHDNDVHGKGGCKLFETNEAYVNQWRKEHARRDFVSKVQDKGYDHTLVATVLKRERNRNQFQGHKDVYEALLKTYNAN